MKFLSKQGDSKILQMELQYREGGDNRQLRKLLIQEQYWFCAYTETYCTKIDQFHVEHFLPRAQEGENGYYNLYAVTPWANHQKLRKRYAGSFFFQTASYLKDRIRYQVGEYVPTLENDLEACELIEFLGFNHPDLVFERIEHITSLKDLFIDKNHWTSERILNYFKKHPKFLSFPTAIEAEFQIDLSDIILSLTA